LLRLEEYLTTKCKKKTRTISDNGLNPNWNESIVCNFSRSEYDFIVFRLMDSEKFSTDLSIAQFAVRVENIRPGYHVVPLYDEIFRELPISYLFCKFTIN